MYPPVCHDSRFLDKSVVSLVSRDYRVRESEDIGQWHSDEVSHCNTLPGPTTYFNIL